MLFFSLFLFTAAIRFAQSVAGHGGNAKLVRREMQPISAQTMLTRLLDKAPGTHSWSLIVTPGAHTKKIPLTSPDNLYQAPEIVTEGLIDSLRASAKNSSTIPKLIHQTWHSWEALYPKQLHGVMEWRRLNPDYRYLFWDDKALDSFFSRRPVSSGTSLLQQASNEVLQDMLAKMKPIERVDTFRYSLLYDIGGVYADVDVVPEVPISKWPGMSSFNSPTRFVAGWEGYLDNDEERRSLKYARTHQVEQWTIAGRPRHPIFKDTLDRIFANYAGGLVGDVLNYTGPGPWSDAVLKYYSRQPHPVDAMLLSSRAFGGDPIKDGPSHDGDGTKLAVHLHLGTWIAGFMENKDNSTGNYSNSSI